MAILDTRIKYVVIQQVAVLNGSLPTGDCGHCSGGFMDVSRTTTVCQADCLLLQGGVACSEGTTASRASVNTFTE
jgi:hypothetical protein